MISARQAQEANHRARLDLQEAGVHVFPVYQRSKRPAVPRGESWRGSLDMTARWFQGTMPAVDCGAAGFVVIDADRHGIDGVGAFHRMIAAHGGLPAGVPVVLTPRNGEHYYFRRSKGSETGCSAGALTGVVGDVKGNRGCVVAPGAVNIDGLVYTPKPGTPRLIDAYAAGAIPELPQWLMELITRKPERPPASAGEQSNSSLPRAVNASRYGDAAMRREVENVGRSCPGFRNRTLFDASLKLASLAAAGALNELDARKRLATAAAKVGLPAFEAKATIQSGFAIGLKNPRKLASL